MRALKVVLNKEDVASVQLTLSRPVASYLQNNKRNWLAELEKSSSRTITIVPDDSCAPSEFSFQCKNARGSKIAVDV